MGLPSDDNLSVYRKPEKDERGSKTLGLPKKKK
jgi:hypothetical protein